MKPSVNRNTLRKNGPKAAFAILRAVMLIGFSYIILYPIILMISKSVMAQTDVFDNSVLWIPKHFTLRNLRVAASSMKYGKALANSLLVAAGSTLMQTFPCMMAGYAFARFNFKGRRLLFAVVILTIIVPPQQFITPLYLHLSRFDIFGLIKRINNGKTLNLMSTSFPYFLISLTGFGLRNGLFVFLFRQSFRGIPREMDEAAMIDGAGQIRIFWQIILPSAVTITVTVMLFSFVWQYNDTYYTNLFLPNLRTLPKAYGLFESAITGWNGDKTINDLLSQYVLDDNNVLSLLRNSAMLLILTPILLVYAFAQRYFIESIERSGIVG